jgi:MFS family permease
VVPAHLLGLLKQPQFLKFWTGQTISQFGSEIGALAIPLTAALVLNASTTEMGLVAAAQFAPFVLVGLLAGVYVDQLPRRAILVGADIGRALVIGLVPCAAVFSVLRIEHLYAIAFLAGVLTVFFDVAYQSYLPCILKRTDLIEGNSKLEMSRSVAQVAGPGLAGYLVQTLGAPIAIAANSASFLVSALLLVLITAYEPSPLAGEQRNLLREITTGVRYVLTSPLLRPIAACTSTANFFSYMFLSVYIVFVVRELAIGAVLLGLILSVGSIGSLLGSLLAGQAARILGLGPAIIESITFGSVGMIGVLLAAHLPPSAMVAMLVAARFAAGFGTPIYNVNQVSLRQATTPDHLQGRINATMRFIAWGTIPLGSFIGGFLGEKVGLQTTILIATIGSLVAPVWVALSPVRSLRGPAA